MKRSLFFYVKPFLVIAALVMFVACWIAGPPQTMTGWLSYIGTVATIMGVISWAYIKWIWYYCFWENTPRFAKKYKGEIHYTRDPCGTKEAEIFIEQTLFSTCVKIKTDEITSDSITSELIEEHGAWFLYYTYITNPKAEFSEKNPVQYGAVRFEIEKSKYDFKTWFLKYKMPIVRLEGKYWTTSKTIGDMILRKEP